MACVWMFLAVLLTTTVALNIDLLDCNPPDVPIGGDYGPKKSLYTPGDMIHYFCPVDTHIGGNYLRICEDTGDWTGETPVCDSSTAFSSSSQTSTADDRSDSQMATDGERTTCSATRGGRRDEWSGTFQTPGELIRVMLFLPIGQVSYEVVLVKPNGQEVICGTQSTFLDRYRWTFHNCPGPHNNGASGLKIRSLSDAPLQICEIQAHVLTSPKCPDPHVRVDSGHMSLDRKSAVLSCDKGFVPSDNSRLECISDGVWNRKRLFCMSQVWEEYAPPDGQGERPVNPDREREKFKDKHGRP